MALAARLHPAPPAAAALGQWRVYRATAPSCRA